MDDKTLDEDLGSNTEPKEETQTKNVDYSMLIDQIEQEFKMAEAFIKPRWDEWTLRLKLYNNQRRDKEAIGDPLLFTIHQTILASLYDDRLNVSFEGRERGDDDQAENLNILAVYDQDDMEKDELDYAWDWDTTFFGRGLCLFLEFDRETNTPIPEIIDPLSFYRDPMAVSVNGNRKGKGALRFFGREVRLTKHEMEEAGVYEDLVDLEKIECGNSANSKVFQNQQLRASAQGFDLQKMKLKGDNKDYTLLEWFTYWEGKKVFVTLSDDRKQVIRIETLKNKKWPVIDRAIFPIAHSWDGVSVPDLVEDKQRARAVIQNLALANVKYGQHPAYLFDTNRITNKNDLARMDFDKYIGVDGNPAGAVQEIQRGQIKQEVGFILDMMDTAAQKATATPDIQQGSAGGSKRTATELNLVSQKVDTRYGLSAKIFGWSEKRFWQQWYFLYKEHFTGSIDKKVVRIAGAMGPTWRKLTRDNVIATNDPDVRIESRVLSEAKRMNDLQTFSNFLANGASQDPSFRKREALKHLGKLSGLTKDELNRFLPDSFDEYEAGEENFKLDKNKLVNITPNQDHFTHIEIHSKASDTKAKEAHIKAHKLSMFIAREKPEVMPMKGNPNLDPNAMQAEAGQPTAKEMSPNYKNNPNVQVQ